MAETVELELDGVELALVGSGFSNQQARAIRFATRSAPSVNLQDFASKRDLSETELRLTLEIKEAEGRSRLEIEKVRGEIKAAEGRLQLEIKDAEGRLQLEMKEVEGRLKLEIEGVRREIKEVEGRLQLEIEKVRGEIKGVEKSLIYWMFGLAFTGVVSLGGFIYFLHGIPRPVI